MKKYDPMTELMQEIEPYRVKLIDFHRDFIKNLILLSAGIVGFSVPILDKSTIIKNQFLFGLSLGLFVLVIIIGVVYIYLIIQKENTMLTKTIKSAKNIFDKHGNDTSLPQTIADNMSKSFVQSFAGDVKAVKLYTMGYKISVFVFLGALIIMILSIFC